MRRTDTAIAHACCWRQAGLLPTRTEAPEEQRQLLPACAQLLVCIGVQRRPGVLQGILNALLILALRHSSRSSQRLRQGQVLAAAPTAPTLHSEQHAALPASMHSLQSWPTSTASTSSWAWRSAVSYASSAARLAKALRLRCTLYCGYRTPPRSTARNCGGEWMHLW